MNTAMTENKKDIIHLGSDDVSVLRELLHSMQGLSPVSTGDPLTVVAENDS